MAFTDVLDLNPSTTIALGGRNKKTGKANPESIEGFYLGARSVESKLAKSGFVKLHVFQTQQGTVGVWGKSDLDNKLQAVKPGLLTRVLQSGTRATPYGDMYLFRVQVDKDNSIDVTGLDTSGEVSTAENDSSGISNEDEESEMSARLNQSATKVESFFKRK